MLRSALFVVLGVVITGFFSFWSVMFSVIPNSENRVHKVARLWAKILLLITNTKVEVIGGKNILEGKPQIFMANHQSDFDIFIVLAYIPGQFRWIAKKELFQVPVFGAAMRKAGYIEIDRQNHAKALQSLEEAAMRIREGKSVMTFPEGTRSRDGEIKAFKQGTFHLALQAGVPIVPVTIVGSGKIMPKRSLRITPGRIKLIIDKPIDVGSYTVENRHELIGNVRQIIIKNYDSWKEAGSKNIRDIEKEPPRPGLTCSS